MLEPARAYGRRRGVAAEDPAWVRRGLIGLALLVLAAFLVAPLALVFISALRRGLGAYVEALLHPDARAAIRLTLFTVVIVVPLNVAFGLCAAWLLARYRFPGKRLLATLVDLPFSVSPVVAGLLFVLLFGRQGWLGPWLWERGVQVIFAVPGIVLATLFVTFPFVGREVLPVLQEQGAAEEEAAVTLGASGFQVFFYVTLPKIKWGLLYGVILCTARAMGEFGAVSVVSGHVRGVTNTMPLHVEVLYNEYDAAGAFAVASLLTLLAVATLVAKKVVEWRSGARAAGG